MPKRLIINADGFGFTYGNNRAIFEAIKAGSVTSVSVNTSFPAVEEASALATDFPHISIGVHLNLQVGAPVCPPDKVPTLVNSEGQFWGSHFVSRLMTGRISYHDMSMELEEQFLVLIRRGIRPTHWDGHQNKHLYPPYLLTAMHVARKIGILRIRCHNRWLFVEDIVSRRRQLLKYYFANPKRILTHGAGKLISRFAKSRGFNMADRLISPAYLDESQKYNLGTWLGIFRHLPEGTSEIYCHPGYVDDTLRKYATYVEQREQEREILLSEEFKTGLSISNIELISFHQL